MRGRPLRCAVEFVLCTALGGLLLGPAAGCGRAGEAAKGREAAEAGRVVPVVAAKAERKDVPIYLDGLGTVTALQTVVVRSQVDGPLQRVLFREGQSVRKGELLAQIDPRPFQVQLRQAEGALARDRALLQNAKLNLERLTTLNKERLIAAQQLDDQTATVRQAEGTVLVDQAAVDSARLLVEYAAITAPIDGVTGIRQVDPGNLVQKGDAGGIVVVAQIDPIAVIFSLPQDDLQRVAAAQAAAPLSIEARGRDGGEVLGQGRLSVIDNQINQTTSTIRLKAIFDNPRRLLWPNQFVKARLLLTVRKGALTVPAQVVQRGPKGSFAYVIKSDATVETRSIQVAQIAGTQALIEQGLSEGEQVVVDGQSQLRPGAKVATREAQ